MLQIVRRGRAVTVVDVHAVRLRADRNHIGAEFVEHMARDVVGRAVRAVHHDLQSAQVQFGGKGALAEFDVAAGRIVDALGFAQPVRGVGLHLLIQCRLDGALDLVGQLGAVRPRRT